ncbi:hypothetical protein Droror1_Dr00027518 [Drosera rotundifolia]
MAWAAWVYELRRCAEVGQVIRAPIGHVVAVNREGSTDLAELSSMMTVNKRRGKAAVQGSPRPRTTAADRIAAARSNGVDRQWIGEIGGGCVERKCGLANRLAQRTLKSWGLSADPLKAEFGAAAMEIALGR